MHLVSKRSLPLLLGGIEREYALVYPQPEGENEHFHWTLTMRVIEDLEKALVKKGKYVEHLWTAGSGTAKYMLPDGGCVSCEGPNVFEISSPEAYDARTALAYLDDYKDLFVSALHCCEDLPERTVLSDGPSALPRFEPPSDRSFDLAFHLNYAAELTRAQGLEFCTMLAVLMPLLGCGGLTLRGFSCSPRGFMVRRALYEGFRPWWVGEMARQVRSRQLDDGEEGREGEGRFHVSCLDAPLTRRMAALLFEACQLLLALVLYGEGPLRGKRLAHPEQACVALSGGDCDRRFDLQGGGTAGAWELQEALRGGLERIGRDFALKPAQESALEALLTGLRALRRGDEEELAERFDGHLRKSIYRALLENEGVSLSYFNRVAVPAAWHASRLCSGLPELATLSPGEAESMVKNGRLQEKRKLLSLLGRNRISPGDLPSLARLVQRVITLEIRLHQLYPQASPLMEYDAELWASWLEAREPLPGGLPPTRASIRGKLVEALGGLAGRRCRADWRGLYVFFPHRKVGVFSLPDPHRPSAFFQWVDVPLKEECMQDEESRFADLATNRDSLFYEKKDYAKEAKNPFPHLPDKHPLLKFLRYGISEGQAPLFDADDMEKWGFNPGRPRHITAGQLRLF